MYTAPLWNVTSKTRINKLTVHIHAGYKVNSHYKTAYTLDPLTGVDMEYYALLGLL